MYGSLTFLPHSNFAIFDGWYFLQYCSQRAENCTNCPTLSALSTFAFNSYIRPRLLWVMSYASEEKCKQWRQQRLAYKWQLCTCITLFCTFLWRHCTTTAWTSLISRFMEDVNKRQRMVPKKPTPGKLAYIWRFQGIGINTTKLKKREFIIKVTFSLPSPSSMVKLPINKPRR